MERKNRNPEIDQDPDALYEVSRERQIPELRESDLPDTGRSSVKDADLQDEDDVDRLDEK